MQKNIQPDDWPKSFQNALQLDPSQLQELGTHLAPLKISRKHLLNHQ